MDLCNSESPQAAAAEPIAQPAETADGRRELARLIGRLLAHHWLHQQQTRDHRSAGESAADDHSMRSD